MAGTMVWKTELTLDNESVSPALRDSFKSSRFTVATTGEMSQKYTQYIEHAFSPEHRVEKIDFGLVEFPKYLLFSNLTPNGAVGVPIFIGVGLARAPYEDSQVLPDGTPDSTDKVYAGTLMCFEIKPGETIGPLIVPGLEGYQTTDFDADAAEVSPARLYYFAYLGSEAESSSSSSEPEEYATRDEFEAEVGSVEDGLVSAGMSMDELRGRYGDGKSFSALADGLAGTLDILVAMGDAIL